MVFGLLKILGYDANPRFRDLNDQRMWRATKPGVKTSFQFDAAALDSHDRSDEESAETADRPARPRWHNKRAGRRGSSPRSTTCRRGSAHGWGRTGSGDSYGTAC
jgi:hypothetical protein